MTHNGCVGNTGGGGTHKNFHIRVILPNQLSQALFHMGTHFRCSQGQAVIGVNRAFDAAGPGEGLLRAEEYRLNGK